MTKRCELINDRIILKGLLEQIYSSTDEKNAQIAFGNSVRSFAKYHDLFEVALNEKLRQLSNDPLLKKNKEIAIKENWLLSLIAYCFINLFVVLVSFYSMKNTLITDKEQMKTFMILGITIVYYIGGSWLAYHCAYKESGSKLLFWIIWVVPLYTLSIVIKEKGINLSLLSALCFIVFAFFWINSLRLRKINLQEQAKRELTALKEII